MKIVFFDNSTALKTVNDLESGARGGMVSSLFAVSDGLSLLGHDVSVFSDIKTRGVTNAGVCWKNSREVTDNPYDVLICNRTTSPDGFGGINAKHRILWTHDLPHSDFIPNPKIIKAFRKVVFMSRYAEKIWRVYYPLIGKSIIIPNGVDKLIFFPRDKDYNYIIYGSAPNRGLQYLDLILMRLRNRVRKSLYLKAFSNLQTLHPMESVEYEVPMMVGMDFKNNSVLVQDPVPQRQWAEELGKASLMIMPTAYPEICSNVILQSLASGTPIVTTGNLGSAGEWITSGYNGFMTQYLPNDYLVFIVELVRGARDIIKNQKFHKKMIRNTAKTKHIMTWGEVTKRWDKMLRRL